MIQVKTFSWTANSVAVNNAVGKLEGDINTVLNENAEKIKFVDIKYTSVNVRNDHVMVSAMVIYENL